MMMIDRGWISSEEYRFFVDIKDIYFTFNITFYRIDNECIIKITCCWLD